MKKIAVVMGGPSSEAEVSLNSGRAVLEALRSKGYNAEALVLEPKNFIHQLRELQADFVFNVVHGKLGEDGILQGTLEMMGIPYTGSGVMASSITMDKVATKRFFLSTNVPTPNFKTYLLREYQEDSEAILQEIRDSFSFPLVVKAATQGSSIGVVIVEEEAGLLAALEEAFSYDREILVEEFIKGRELTVAVWGNGKETEAFPIIEITTVTGKYDYETKYKPGASTHIVPAQLDQELTEKVKSIATKAYDVFGCQGIARIDFMLDEENNPYAIEVNTVPGMTATSLVPDAGRAMGMEFTELCEKLLLMAGYEK